MDAGGLMTYNMYQGNQPNALPVPNNGFGTRGKNSHIRNINVPAGQQQQNAVSDRATPRTARGHLLANLRTTRATPAQTPTSAHPANDGNMGYDAGRYVNMPRTATFAPKTARGLGLNTAVGIGGGQQNSPMSPGGVHLQSPQLPMQPASSPIDYKMQQNMGGMVNPAAYNYLMDLAVQQQRLQAQLLAAQQAAQQLEALQATGAYQNVPNSAYPQQLNSMVPVYNQATGQYNFYVVPQQAVQLQQQQQQQQQPQTPVYQQPQQFQQQYQQPQQQVSVAPQREPSPPAAEEQREVVEAASNRTNTRSRSPPKVGPIQAPSQASSSSGNASFRRHRKASSLSNCLNANGLEIDTNAPKTSVPKLSNIPTTPMTATFAPGHASGTHPSRQPRGPPPLDEVKAKPTSKFEGSKNFASRQRRRAIFKIVTAGAERRGAARSSGSAGGTMTPVSENEATYNFDDSHSCTSSLSGKQSLQSLRAGDESPKEYSGSSVSGDEGLGGRFVEIKKSSGGLKTPQMILDAAEKRKSAMF